MGEQGHQRGHEKSGGEPHSADIVEANPLSEAARYLPVALIGLLLVVSTSWDGAFDLRYWSPLTVLALALLMVLCAAGAVEVPRRGPLAASVAAVWALAAFVLLSVLWSETPYGAWVEAGRTAFYAAIWTLAAGSGARGEWRGRLGAALMIGLAAIAAITLVRLLMDGQSHFLAGRLNSPIGYRNATAALFAFSAWPLIGYAARRGGSSALRAAAFAFAVLVLGLAFLTQSRGMLLGLALGGLVSLAIGPDRLRRSWLAIAAIAVIALVSGPLLTPYHAFTAGKLVVGDGDISHAAWALTGLVGATFVAGLFLAVFDNGLRSAAIHERLRIGAVVCLVLAVFGAGAVALAKVGNPVSYAESKVREFDDVESSTAGGSTRFGSVGGQRSDLWRVAFDEFSEHPLAGAGAGTYQFRYYAHRRTDRNLNDPHSLPIRLLADTGLIGFALFALWIVAIGWVLVRRARECGEGERMWVAGLAAASATVLTQAFVDWIWLIPGLLGLSVLALGLACGGEAEPAPAVQRRFEPLRIAAAVALAAAIVSVAFLFLGDFYVRKARVEAFTSPASELDAARTAAWFNPDSVSPLYLQASALESMGRRSEAKSKLSDALKKEPDNFVTLGVLGDFEVRRGNERQARAYYRRALALDPLDVGLRKLSEGAE